MADSLQRLSELGQSVWIDYLSRDILKNGGLQRMVEEESVTGVTSNPTIFQQAISHSDLYDAQLNEVARREEDPRQVFLELARVDIQEACDILAPVYEQTGGSDGYVSLEVSPDLAYDTEATVREAMRLHELVSRPNLMVKIPATEPGLAAIEEVISHGKSINVTLIFSLERYTRVARSYIRGLARLVAAGGDPSRVASVASFFVSRVDSETDKRLDALGAPAELKGKLGIANSRLAYQRYKEIFSGPHWSFLESKGASRQRLLWASTSTKNPAYRDVMYVEELIGPGTVNTMPEQTLEAFKDHGEARLTLEEGVEEARALFEQLEEVGVDYHNVTEVLEEEGVQKFVDSFRELLKGVRDKGRHVVR